MGDFVYFEDYEDHIKQAKKSITLDSLEKWLDESIDYLNDLLEKQKIKPYGEEKRYIQTRKTAFHDVKSKIKFFKEKA